MAEATKISTATDDKEAATRAGLAADSPLTAAWPSANAQTKSEARATSAVILFRGFIGIPGAANQERKTLSQKVGAQSNLVNSGALVLT